MHLHCCTVVVFSSVNKILVKEINQLNTRNTPVLNLLWSHFCLGKFSSHFTLLSQLLWALLSKNVTEYSYSMDPSPSIYLLDKDAPGIRKYPIFLCLSENLSCTLQLFSTNPWTEDNGQKNRRIRDAFLSRYRSSTCEFDLISRQKI